MARWCWRARRRWRDLDRPPPPQVLAAIGAAASYTDPARLPTLTYGPGSPVRIRFDSEIVDVIPAPSAHTDGDTIVRFEKADVMMIGDFYRNYGYPFIDATHGGSYRGVVEALDLVASLCGPNTQLVPGHGSTISCKDLAAYRTMIVDTRARVAALVAQGKNLQDVLAAGLTSRPTTRRFPAASIRCQPALARAPSASSVRCTPRSRGRSEPIAGTPASAHGGHGTGVPVSFRGTHPSIQFLNP